MVTDKKPAWHDSAQIVPNEQNVRVQQSPNCNVGAIFWPPCVGPLLTKIHAREASRHVHAGALISVSSGGPEREPAARRAQGHSTGPFFGPGERFASAMIICEPSSNQHPPLRTRKEPCGSRKAVRPSSRERRRRQLDKAPDFLRPWGGRLYNLVSAEELRSLFNFFFLQKV